MHGESLFVCYKALDLTHASGREHADVLNPWHLQGIKRSSDCAETALADDMLLTTTQPYVSVVSKLTIEWQLQAIENLIWESYHQLDMWTAPTGTN